MPFPRVAIRDRGKLAAAGLLLIAACSTLCFGQQPGSPGSRGPIREGVVSICEGVVSICEGVVLPSNPELVGSETPSQQADSICEGVVLPSNPELVGSETPSQQASQHKDSAIVIRPIPPDSLPSTLAVSNGAVPFHQTKSPWLAVGMSAVIPGSGQIYNADYWKAPIVWGLGGYWIYEWVKLNNLYHDNRDLYEQSLNDPLIEPAITKRYKDIRDFYHDERDKFAWYLGALYMVNLVDAYVGAHLYDFDVSGDLGADGRITPKVMATVHLRF